ncbi:MAG: PCMD domain-containing protein [Muribaculaceae bacterium]|nr:PCMD domain-containing protein [Muribaculaceae bacterium]
MNKNLHKSVILAAMAFISLSAFALRLEPIKFGAMNQWYTREISESAIIGGGKKTLYEIAPAGKTSGNKAYRNLGGSPWATSNVYAKVSGVVKGSCAVEPATVGGQKMAKVQAKMEHVKALGIINMDVMVAGTIFLGEIVEPITSTKTPFGKMSMGMPYTKRPQALVFDYKVDMPNVTTRIKASGLGAKKTLQGRDQAEVYVLLQKRWEDAQGNIHAQRVGTGRERYSKSVPLTKGHQLKIHYGDITKQSFYKPWMGLLNGAKAYYAKNSKGKLVPVQEEGWAPADAVPTHVLLMASSSCGEPFVGTEGVTLYVSNFAFGF